MRIVAFADTHTQHQSVKLPEGDVLIFAGDGEFRHVLDMIKFNDWLSGLKYQSIIVIAGNHDFYCERYPSEVKGFFTKAVYLKDEPFVLPNGMSIWGSPMTPTFLNWENNGTEDIIINKIKSYVARINRKPFSEAWGNIPDIIF